MTSEKQFEVIKWILFGIALYMVYKLLNKFGLVGTTENDDKVKALGEGSVVGDLGLTKTNKVVDDAVKKVQKDLGRKVAAGDMKAVLSSPRQMMEYYYELINAPAAATMQSKSLYDDDEDAVFNVFRKLRNQYDVHVFAVFFKTQSKKDLFAFLDSFLSTSEIAKIQDIINSKQKA